MEGRWRVGVPGRAGTSLPPSPDMRLRREGLWDSLNLVVSFSISDRSRPPPVFSWSEALLNNLDLGPGARNAEINYESEKV